MHAHLTLETGLLQLNLKNPIKIEIALTPSNNIFLS